MTDFNQNPLESFVVAKAVTTMPSTGTLNNTTTGAVNLADGQLGLVSTSPLGTVALNSFVDATPTIDEAPVVALFQGTSASANPQTAAFTYPLWVRPYEQTANLDGRGQIVVTKQLYAEPTHSIWAIGKPTGTTGEVNVLNDTEYALTIGFRGHYIEEMYSSEEAAWLRASVVTPNFTSTPSITLPVDWILTYLAWNINRNSRVLNMPGRYNGNDPVIAFAVADIATGGTAIAGLTAGTFLPVVNTQFGTRGITLTQGMIDSLTAASAATGFTHILTIDLANAGTATGGTVEGLWIMGLDRELVFSDRIPQRKTRIVAGLKSGFNSTTVYSAEVSKAFEGEGIARNLDLWYRATQGQRKYNLRHVHDPIVEFPSPIDLNTNYVTYNILHSKTTNADSINVVRRPMREVVLIPSTNTTLISTFDTVLNSWLTSGNNQAIVSL